MVVLPVLQYNGDYDTYVSEWERSAPNAVCCKDNYYCLSGSLAVYLLLRTLILRSTSHASPGCCAQTSAPYSLLHYEAEDMFSL